MRKITQLVISLPLFVVPLVLGGTAPLKAEVKNVGATGAVRLLSQSSVADAKCHYLTSGENSELNGYSAKAEIAAARMTSTDATKQARRQGRKLGKTMICGKTGEGIVRATLDAARRAMVAARAQSKTRKVVVRQQPKRRIVVRRKPASEPRVIVNASSLTRYRRVTEAYYLERRCQHLSRSKAVRFWKQIVSSHSAVLRKYSSSQVAKAKSGAERAARNQGRCGSRTARIVMAGFRG